MRRTLEPTCRLCRRPENRDLRERWGCDGPAEAWGRIPCPSCGDEADEDCATCGGAGHLELTRCPWSMIGPRERYACEVAVLLEGGLLPFGGGWDELPASLVQAVRIVARERAEIERRRLDASGGG
jgi:hypothetical protein